MLNFINLGITGFLAVSGMGAGAVSPSAPVVMPIAIVSTSTVVHMDRGSGAVALVRLTAYNPVAEQTDGDPHITASGAYSNSDIVAARSRDLANEMPFGTVIALESPRDAHSCGFKQVEHFIGYRVIADTMHARKTKQIDIMFSESDTVRVGDRVVNPAVAMGVCTATVRVVGVIDMKDIPETQEELAMMVNRTLAMR